MITWAWLLLIIYVGKTKAETLQLHVLLRDNVITDKDIDYIVAAAEAVLRIIAMYGSTVTYEVRYPTEDPTETQGRVLLRRKCESSETIAEFLKTVEYYYKETQQRIIEYLHYEPINAMFEGKGVEDI